MEENVVLARFLDEFGLIMQLPRRQAPRRLVLEYLAEKFDVGAIYTERQVNEICARWHTFDDYFLLRRELIESGLMARERDGSKYWRVPQCGVASPGDKPNQD